MKEQNPIIRLLQGKSIEQVKKKLCGQLLGTGVYRDVYVFKQYPEFVIKIERDMSIANFTNVSEWRNYIDLQNWKWFGRFLAPCEAISMDGQILIQYRVSFKEKKKYPKKIPVYFTDVKIDNFGWIGRKFVCCDYAFLLQPPKSKKPYKKAVWR